MQGKVMPDSYIYRNFGLQLFYPKTIFRLIKQKHIENTKEITELLVTIALSKKRELYLS